MTTIVEKTSEGIIYRAAKTYPIPDVDILTLLFGKPKTFLPGSAYNMNRSS
jgi:hypothetical protein